HYLHDLTRRLALRQRRSLRDARSRESAKRQQSRAAGQDQSVSHRHRAYVYTIGYRPDLLKGVTFESWADLWRPEVKGKLAAPDFAPSHLIVVSAILSGGDAATWEKGQAKLKELKPSFKAFYTNDANSQQLIANGETPVQVILSMNAHYMAGEGVPITLVIPKEA